MRTQFEQKHFHSPENLEGIWQILYPEHFINVLLIHHLKRRGEKEILGIASIMRSGLMYESTDDPKESHKISDIFKPFQSEDGSVTDPKLILINGAPGMGKTTLCKEIAYQWANKKLLIDTKVVFLLFLRDPAVHKIHDLKDFIHYFYKFKPSFLDLSKQCAEILTMRDNSDITILMDGYDEFNDEDNDSLIKNIIERDILSQCRIVITSRPIASENLQKLADVRVEVLGFTQQSRREYIEKELKEYPEKIESLLHYLSDHSDINRVCYIPIMMTIMVCTFKEIEELPTNQSELYERFITLAISRCVQKLDQTSILSLNRLPKKYQQYLHQLSEFAFKTIEDDKIVFTDMDIERLSPTLASSSKGYQGLGLLRATEHLSIKKMENCIWYNFLHLSIHEFLAAYYLKTLEPCEQFKILKRTLLINRYINVWSLFVGLQQNVSYHFHHFLTCTYIQEASDTVKDHVMLLLQKIHLLNFSEIKNFKLKGIKGIFQFFCSKSNVCTDHLPTNVSYDNNTEFDTKCLFWWSTNLFVSLCNTDNSDQLIEIYFLDKNMKFDTYYQLIEALKENQNLSVMLLSSNTLVGYRSNHRQLTNALNINKSLEYITLRYCLIDKDITKAMSSYLKNSNCLRKLCITNSKVNNNLEQLCRASDRLGLPAIMTPQALQEHSRLKVLDLDDNNLTAHVAEELATIIKNNSGLEELYLSNNSLKTHVAVILKALKEKSVLKIIHLNNNLMTEEVAEDLATVIRNNSSLEKLCIGNNMLGLSAVMILQALQEHSRLKVLNICDNNLSAYVAKDLVTIIKNNSCLEKLYLSNNSLKTSAALILKALKEKSVLKILHLNNNLMTEEIAEDLATVIRNNSSLEKLCIGNNMLGLSAVMVLQALKEHSRLKVLNINDNNLTAHVAEDLATIIKTNSSLEKLYLSNNSLKTSAGIILKALKEKSVLKVLHLNNNLMTEEVAEDLAAVIRNNSSLEQLCIGSNKLGLSAVMILQALQEHSRLKVLNISDNNLTPNVAEDLATIIKINPGLEELYLSNNGLKTSAAIILKALKEKPFLKILHLNDTLMTEEVAEDLAVVIRSNSSLEQLCVEKNRLGLSAVMILQALQEHSRLKVLNLSDNNLTAHVAEDLARIVKNNLGLEELYLSNNSLKTSAIVLLRALKEKSILKKLYLYNSLMTEEVAEDLAVVIRNNSSLEQLCIGNNRLGLPAVMILQALQKHSRLKVLDLDNNNLTAHVAEDLARIVKNNSGLQELYLSNNGLKTSAAVILKALKEKSVLKILHLNNNLMTEEVAEDLAVAIRNNSRLEQLCIGYNRLGLSAVLILQALQEHSRLKVLNLSDNNLTAHVAKDLATIIKNNSGLEELYLSNNSLKTSAAVILKALKEKSVLKILHLNSNLMTDEVGEDLAVAIRNNSSLEKLCIGNNMLGLSAVMILQALQKHSRLKVLNLSDNNLTAHVAEDLATIIKNNSGLEELYLHDNSLQTSAAVILKVIKENSLLTNLHLNNNFMTEEVAKYLADVIKNNNNLKQLSIENSRLGSSAVEILDALQEKTRLKVLNLGSNNLTAHVAKDLASVMCNNPNLENLTIRNNMLGSTAGKVVQGLVKTSKLKVLNLISNKLTKEVSQDLAVVISNNSGLERLYLSDNDLRSSAIKILQALKLNSQLCTLYLSNCLSESIAVELVSVIKSNPLISELWLGDNTLQSRSIDIVQSCNGLSNLRALGLSCNNISPREVLHLVLIIANIISLQVLQLGNLVSIAKDRFLFNLYNAIKQKCSLQNMLSFSDNEVIKVMCLEKWRSHFAGRIKLNYHARKFFPTDVINIKMVPSCAKQNLSNVLSIVEQSEEKISQLNASYMITTLSVLIKRLKLLDLEYSNMDNEAAIQLATALDCNNVLEQLWLRGNVLGAVGATIILTSLQNITTLRVLDLSYNNISSRSANGIAAVINSNHFLEQLWLDGNMLMTTGVVIIAKALKKHSNLTLLSLSNNEITEDAAEELSAIVNSNNLLGGLLLSNNQLQFTHLSKTTKFHGGIHFLHILELSNNFINATAADELAVTLSNCVCLKELYLGNNNLGTTGGIKILQAVKNIPILQVLSLNNNNITTEAASEICNVINTNINLDILLLGDNDLQTSGVLQIVDTVKNNNPTMQLLSLSDNNVDKQVKEDVIVMLCDQCDLELFI